MAALEPPRQTAVTFPSGLYQPQGSFRFSVDALLLGSFFRGRAGRHIVDLGSGCGIVGLTHLLANPLSVCVGIDCQPELVEASIRNAAHLGCHERYLGLHGYVEKISASAHEFFYLASQKTAGINQNSMIKVIPPGGGFDIALANPPYRILGKGRLPASGSRRIALFGNEDTVGQFCMAAYSLLAPHGILGIVFPFEGLKKLVDIVGQTHLYVQRVMTVFGKQGKKPVLALLEAQKTEPERCVHEPPLVLYDTTGSLTDEAVGYCPFLAR